MKYPIGSGGFELIFIVNENILVHRALRNVPESQGSGSFTQTNAIPGALLKSTPFKVSLTIPRRVSISLMHALGWHPHRR